MSDERQERLKGMLEEAIKPIIKRLDNIEKELKDLKASCHLDPKNRS